MTICLFLVSFSAIYLQIAWIHSLAHIYYGALTYFIISLALIGFGASGTFLAVFRKKLHYSLLAVTLFLFLTLVSIPLFSFLTNLIPLNLLYIFYDQKQIFFLFLFSLCLFIPFFFCGLIIGFILINEKRKEFYYGVNLLGSGAGGLAALISMYFLEPVYMAQFALIPLSLSFIILIIRSDKHFPKGVFIPLTILIFSFFLFLPEGEPDQYKDIYRFKILEKQGDARLIASKLSPFGKLEAWDSPLSHSTLFAGLENEIEAPSQLTLFSGGDYLSPLFKITSGNEGEILDNTIQSLPYRILENPHVLLVGDYGLVNLWLALRYNAASVTVLLPSQSVREFLENDLSRWTEQFQNRDDIQILVQDYRQFFLMNKNRFDIIQFVSAESLSGSMSGLYTFQEDYNLTVEAFKSAWLSLSERGIISLSRGKQIPQKDNLKILLTLYKSAGELSLSEPENHIYQLSNYLAAISLFSRREIKGEIGNKLVKAYSRLNLKTEYSAGEIIDYKGTIKGEIFDIRPAEDNRPFFNSFFRWESLRNFYNLYGSYWFRDSDLGYLILLVTFVIILILVFLLVLLPHFFRKATLKNPFLFYFFFIGLAFMFIEMVLIQKMSLFLGHSSISVSLVLSSLLVFSGVGSMVVEKVDRSMAGKQVLALTVISAVLFFLLIFSDEIIIVNSFLARFSILFSWVFMLLICCPVGFFLGWFFAPALNYLERTDRKSLPLAWAVNGFASVAASPLAVLLTISMGFFLPAAAAVFLYLLAILLFCGR